MNELGVSVAWCVLQVTLVALLALGGSVLARRLFLAAGTQLPLAGLLVVVGLTAVALSPWPSWWDLAGARSSTSDLAAGERRDGPASVSSAPSDHDLASSAEQSTGGRIPAGERLAAFLEELSRDLSRPANLGETPATRSRWPLGLSLLVSGLALLGGVQLAGGLLAVRAYRRRSQPIVDAELLELVDVLSAELSLARRVELRQNDDLVTAATVGWLRPLVLLPPEWKTWTPAERRTVLAHELAHIARHDFAGSVLAQLSVTLHFYHPLVHWLAARLRLEQEFAADAAAAALVGGPKVYLRTLADLALRQPERRMSWPARTFLPSRGTFLRRIEMLRDARHWPTSPVRGSRWAMLIFMFGAGLLALGLRSPTGLAPSTADAQQAAPASQPKVPTAEAAAALAKKGIDAAYVSDDAVAVAAVRPAGLLLRPDMKEVRRQLDEWITKELTMSPAEVEQITLVLHGVGGRAVREAPILPICGIIVRAVEPTDFAKLTDRILPDAVEKRLGGAANQVYFRSEGGKNAVCYYQPDDRTLLIDLEEHVVKSIVGKAKVAPLLSSEAWKKAAEGQVALAIDGTWLRTMIALANDGIGRNSAQAAFAAQFEAFSPLWLEADVLTFSARLDERLTLRASAVCGNADGAKKVQETAEAARTLARNMLKPLGRQAAQASPAEAPIIGSLLELGEGLLEGSKFERVGNVVEVTTTSDIDTLRLSLMAMVVIRMRDAAVRTESANNLKQIGLAMHNYHDTFGHFPAAVMLGPDGKTTHSWRVAILPYIEGAELHRAYKFDEPWDSENNKKVLAAMPAVFRHPLAPRDATSAAYYAITNENSVFSDKPSQRGTRISDILDGTSNTLMIVEAKRDIPWTKPEDIPFVDGKPLPKLGGWTEAGFYAGLCDGSVHLVGGGIDGKLLRQMILRNDGEATNFDPAKIPNLPRPEEKRPPLNDVDAPVRRPIPREE